MKPIDRLINGISMYRLLMYYLLGLLAAAIMLSWAGDLHYNPLYIALSAITLVVACWIINWVLATIFEAPVNPESSILTGLILALILPPTLIGYNFLFLLAAAGLAMASKYILTYRMRHIFNPAAIAVVLTGLGPHQYASWWVGTAFMAPLVIVGGIFISRKVRREHMVISFFIATTVATAAFALLSHAPLKISLTNMVLSSAVLFLGFVMLTEPYTSPTTRRKQILYACIVGVIIPPQAHLFSLYSTPEIALIVGNIYAFIVSPKVKLFPILHSKLQIAARTFEFAFLTDKKLAYQPGQYMEWTLPHNHVDARGSRRIFTLASSPTEDVLRIGVKFYEKSSSYKQAMSGLDEDSQLVAAQISGDFVMPQDTTVKLAFIAGGIGITPFRSMIKYMIDTKTMRDVHLFYSARNVDDFAYMDFLESARKEHGLQTNYHVTRSSKPINPFMRSGPLNAAAIQQELPDYLERTYYISGTPAMVRGMEESLHALGIHHSKLVVDDFSGY